MLNTIVFGMIKTPLNRKGTNWAQKRTEESTRIKTNRIRKWLFTTWAVEGHCDPKILTLQRNTMSNVLNRHEVERRRSEEEQLPPVTVTNAVLFILVKNCLIRNAESDPNSSGHDVGWIGHPPLQATHEAVTSICRTSTSRLQAYMQTVVLKKICESILIDCRTQHWMDEELSSLMDRSLKSILYLNKKLLILLISKLLFSVCVCLDAGKI